MTYHQSFPSTGLACRVYIDAEEKGLRETLETLVREESWKPMEDAAQTNVLRSASELFAVIKKSLTRCARFVSRGEPMLHLMGAFQVGPLALLWKGIISQTFIIITPRFRKKPCTKPLRVLVWTNTQV